MTKEILLTALVLAPIVSTIALMPYYRQLDGIAIASLILHRLDKSKYTVINDVIFPALEENKLIQIPHVIVSVYGIIIINAVNRKGIITGSEEEEVWV